MRFRQLSFSGASIRAPHAPSHYSFTLSGLVHGYINNVVALYDDRVSVDKSSANKINGI